MKKINLAFLLLIIVNCKAQTPIISLSTTDYVNIPNNAYIKDVEGILNPFVGTWKWTDASTNSEFTVVFVKIEENNYSGINPYYEDKIFGGYKYVLNGVLIAEKLIFTTEFVPTDISTFNAFAPISSNIHSPFDNLSLFISDIVKNKLCFGSFEFINPDTGPNGQWLPTEARWKMWNRETWIINNQTPQPQIGFSIPTDIVLTKIN